jgi:L-asparaginase
MRCTKTQYLYFYPVLNKMQAKPHIVILATGGTIAGVAPEGAQDTAYTAGVLGVETLIAAVPQLASHARISTEQVANIDSKDMSTALWWVLAARVRHWLAQADIDACVITHGTDTLEETAYFLHLTHASAKPIVMTAAMRPASSAEADGPRNLLDAVRVAADSQAQGRGVMCVLHGRVHAAQHVRKMHTVAIDAFSSGDVKPLAILRDFSVEWTHSAETASAYGEFADAMGPACELPLVPVVLSHAQADGIAVQAYVQAGAKGIVVAGTGNGTIHHVLEAALTHAQAQGVRVVRASRVPVGEVPAMGGRAFEASGELSPYKARVRLMLELAIPS